MSVLEVSGLTKRFGALIANEDVSLVLSEGEIHAVIGPNGAGKSTLIAQICGSLAPDTGTVRFAGADMNLLSPQARARLGLARTFQISALAMDDTVLENAMLGALGASARPWRFFRPILSNGSLRQIAERALERAGLAGHEAKRASALSHGQRRQLEIALALTLTPKAFVMDEPMAGLGAEGTKALTSLLGRLKREAPILLVEHDMDAVFALADRITVLDYGRVIATGTVKEIRENSEVQRAYLGDMA
ncbi:MAG: ABC transporter ATP-binding protein [Pseudomonadota bacterium]